MVCFQRGSQHTDSTTRLRRPSQSFTTASCVPLTPALSILVLLDLSAAFDTGDHAILFEVLTERFGVENLELDWFRSYHTGRTQTFTTPSGSTVPIVLTCSSRFGDRPKGVNHVYREHQRDNRPVYHQPPPLYGRLPSTCSHEN